MDRRRSAWTLAPKNKHSIAALNAIGAQLLAVFGCGERATRKWRIYVVVCAEKEGNTVAEGKIRRPHFSEICPNLLESDIRGAADHNKQDAAAERKEDAASHFGTAADELRHKLRLREPGARCIGRFALGAGIGCAGDPKKEGAGQMPAPSLLFKTGMPRSTCRVPCGRNETSVGERVGNRMEDVGNSGYIVLRCAARARSSCLGGDIREEGAV